VLKTIWRERTTPLPAPQPQTAVTPAS
jgi:hypothetical protein